MVSVRLSPEEEAQLTQLSKAQNLSKSEVLKAALQLYAQVQEQQSTPYALGEGLFGQVGSQQSDRSSTYKTRLKTKLHAKFTD